MSRNATNESLETVSRLLDLVPYLSAHQGIALDKLASEFAVTQMQMTQDLNTLWMCGLPGYTPYELIDLSFENGFVTISNAETLQSPRSLNRDEVLALLLGLESLNEGLNSESGETGLIVAALLTKLRALLESRVAKQVRSGNSFSALVLGQVEATIKDRSSMTIKYHSIARDEISERLITPLEIVEQDGVVYLFAFCHTSGGHRTFRADRILEATSVPQEFSRIFENSPVDIAGSTKVTIRISSRRRDAAERLPFKESTNLKEQDIVEFSCFSPEWAVREILSFGGALTVISPDTLRSAVRDHALSALDGYSTRL